MAAITPTLKSTSIPGGSRLEYFGTGTANQSDTMTSVVCPEGAGQVCNKVSVVYSAAPTETGVIVTLDSGRGSAYDETLYTFSADIRHNVYLPEQPIPLLPGDAILVTAPAAGGVITAAVKIDLEQR